MPEVSLDYVPRPIFVPFHERTERWAAMVAHRRAGKTVAAIMDLIDGSLRCPSPDPRHAYVAPTYAQAKDIAWEYLKRFTRPLNPKISESELSVVLPGNRRIRLYGSDNPDRLRGGYLDGVVLDEFAYMDPRTWTEIIRPALSDRIGWAAFISTANGRNAFHKMLFGNKATGWVGAIADGNWYAEVLRASETGILSVPELADARRTMTPEQYGQEYECDFNAAIMGAYFAKDLVQAETDQRIGDVPYDRAADVFAGWDLGVSDDMAIWFGQPTVGGQIKVIDYLSGSGHGLDWYVDRVNEKSFKVAEHFLPHDAEVREMTSGAQPKSRVQYLRDRNLQCSVVPRVAAEMDWVNAVRMVLNRCWFDAKRCEDGLEGLRMFQDRRDEKRDISLGPLHDWASHPAAAFGTFVRGLQEARPALKPQARRVFGQHAWMGVLCGATLLHEPILSLLRMTPSLI